MYRSVQSLYTVLACVVCLSSDNITDQNFLPLQVVLFYILDELEATSLSVMLCVCFLYHRMELLHSEWLVRKVMRRW